MCSSSGSFSPGRTVDEAVNPFSSPSQFMSSQSPAEKHEANSRGSIGVSNAVKWSKTSPGRVTMTTGFLITSIITALRTSSHIFGPEVRTENEAAGLQGSEPTAPSLQRLQTETFQLSLDGWRTSSFNSGHGISITTSAAIVQNGNNVCTKMDSSFYR